MGNRYRFKELYKTMDASTSKSTDEQPLILKKRIYLYAVLALLLTLFLALVTSVIALRWVNPPTTSFMLQQDWESLQTERYSLRDHWVSYDEIPKHSMQAVVASEDQLFWKHRGFDFESIEEAWEERMEGEGSRGASTITQQVAKNIYLWPAESYIRKGIEAGITVLIELFWPKERIIEVYLNIAEFGPGIFGIGKASGEFFGLKASEIKPDMSARMAAVLPSPKRMRVNPPSPYAKERSRWILRQMTLRSGTPYVAIDSTDGKATKPQADSLNGNFTTNADTLIQARSINSRTLLTDTSAADQNPFPGIEPDTLTDFPDSDTTSQN